MTTTTGYTVSGMACGHCADTITDEVARIGGVTAVSVDVDKGIVSVVSDRELDPSEVHTAIEEAGYELTG